MSFIQIQHLLKLNVTQEEKKQGPWTNSNTTLVKVKLNINTCTSSTTCDSNTTLVKVKLLHIRKALYTVVNSNTTLVKVK